MRQEERERKEHDILVVRRPIEKQQHGQYFKFPVRKPEETPPQSQEANPSPARHLGYHPCKEIPEFESGHRAVVNLALGERTDDGPELRRGALIATLPVHPDPSASTACTCYLFNPDNLTYVTSWTEEEWNDEQVPRSSHLSNTRDACELLVATPAGRVYLLQKTEHGRRFTTAPIDLRIESELWCLLRNGCVAGSVLLAAPPEGAPRVVPLVNVESLCLREERQGAARSLRLAGARKQGTRLPYAVYALRKRWRQARSDKGMPLQAAGTDASKPPLELTGTYDFKWPLGANIRIAIQRLPEDYDFIPEPKDCLARAIQKLREAFNAWGVRDPAVDPAPTSTEGVPPPQLTYTILGATEDLERGCWPAPPKGRAMRRLTTESFNELPESIQQYDILVSFAPLPLTLPQTQYYDWEDRLLVPQSELGTYARRLDLGLPSMYIGPVRTESFGSWDDWLESDQAKFVFRHEVGHALGLAHEHQNPKRKLDWSSDDSVRAKVKKHHVPVDESDEGWQERQEEELGTEVSPWPRGRGQDSEDEDFSEWREPRQEHDDIDSIMVTPYYRCLLSEDRPRRIICPDEDVPQAVEKEHQSSLYAGLDVSDEDRAQLSRMYQYPPPVSP